MSKNSIRLTVCGTECIVGTDNNEAYVRSLASEVQACMLSLSRQSCHASGAVTAIVAALSFCDDSHKIKEQADTLQKQLQVCLKDSEEAHREAQQARQETERLHRENAALRSRLSQESVPLPEKAADAGPLQRSSTGSFTRPLPASEKDSESFLQYFEDEHETKE
ncbi:MAG: cell division protein ZapA [Oscillospiraceae bacterium]|nr:cell division protein ZapA [Oscillospiraceae bacterium]